LQQGQKEATLCQETAIFRMQRVEMRQKKSEKTKQG